MKFGIALPYWDAHRTARFARLAEENAWDGIFVGDAIWTLDPTISLPRQRSRPVPSAWD